MTQPPNPALVDPDVRRRLFNAAPPTLLVQLDGVIVDANRRLGDLVGRPLDVVIGMSVGTLLGIPSETIRSSAGRCEQQLPDLDLRRPDGSGAVVAPSISPVDEQHYAVFLIDVSHQRAAEERARSAQLAAAAGEEAASMCSWRLEVPSGRFTWSENLPVILGLDRSNVPADMNIADAIREAVHPDDRDRLSEVTAQAIRGGTPIPAEVRIVRPDGSVRWVRGTGRQEMDATGRVVALAGSMRDITEEHNAIETLREREAILLERTSQLQERTSQLEALTAELEEARDIARLATLRRDLRAMTLTWSPHMYRIFGLDPAGPPPTPEELDKLFTPDSLERRAQALAESARTGKPWEIELEFRRRDGSRGWLLQRGLAELDDSGTVIGYHGTAIEITDRVISELALRTSEERYRSIMESAGDAIVLSDDHGIVVGWNAAAERIFGYGAAEIMGRPITQLMTAAVAVGHPEAIARFFVEGSHMMGSTTETVGRRRDGSEIPLEIAVSEWRSGGHRYLTAVIRDVSDRRRAETALRESEAALQAAQRVAKIGSWSRDLRTNENTWSDEMFRIFGIPSSNGEPISNEAWLSRIVPEDRALMEASVEQLHRGEAVEGLEYRIVQPDGTLRIAWGSIVEIQRDKSGRPIRIVGIVQDVTERRMLEEQLRQSQRLESIGQLAAGIAHDFNNLLTAVEGYGRSALDALPPESPAHGDVEGMLAAAGRAVGLTRQLLAFGRRLPLQPQLLDPFAVIDSILPMLRRVVGEHIEISASTTAPGAMVLVDRTQLEQVVVNLVINARDAMPDGGVIAIGVSALDLPASAGTDGALHAAGPHVRIEVCDNGVGIEATILAHLWEPFFTTKAPGEGVGLGLPTVYGIVTQSGGRISCESEPGRGATFRIDLPLIETAAPAAASGVLPAAVVASTAASTAASAAVETSTNRPASAAQESPMQSSPEPSTESLPQLETILVVEDQEMIRRLIDRYLSRLGYRILTAGSGPEGLEIAAATDGPIHLLVTDVIMPGMAGPDLADRLRALRPEMRVLFISGMVDHPSENRGRPAPSPLLPKPFDPPTLLRTIRGILDSEG